MREDAVKGLLRDAGIWYDEKPKGSGFEFSISCPLAPYRDAHKFSADRRPSMGIFLPESGPCLVNCYTCGFRAGKGANGLHLLFSTLSRYNHEFSKFVNRAEGIDVPDTCDMLEALSHPGSMEPVYEEVLDQELMDEFVSYYHEEYLAPRGVDRETATIWNLKYDLVRTRIVLPTYNYEGLLVGAAGRSTLGENPKYYNYWNYSKGNYLYGEHFAKMFGQGLYDIVLVEGQFDAMVANRWLWQTFGKSVLAVASQGCALTKKQRERLISIARTVTLGYDPGVAGERGTQAVLVDICPRIPVYCLNLTPGDNRDPAELGPDIVKSYKARKTVLPPIDEPERWDNKKGQRGKNG